MNEGGYEFDCNGCVWSRYLSAPLSFFNMVHCIGSNGMIRGYPDKTVRYDERCTIDLMSCIGNEKYIND